MVSFKDVLRVESSRKQQLQLPTRLRLRRKALILQDDREEPNREVDDLPDIDEVEIPDCEKSENLLLIGKMLGESVPLKTITSKLSLIGCLRVRLNKLI